MHAAPAVHAGSSQSVLPLQSLSKPSKQFSGPVGLHPGTPLLLVVPLLAPLLVVPLLPAPLLPPLLDADASSEMMKSGTELHATIKPATPKVAPTTATKEKRTTPESYHAHGQQIVVGSVKSICPLLALAKPLG